MGSKELLNICADLLDHITVVKVYIKLSKEHKKIDYSLIMSQHMIEIERLVNNLIDTIKKD